MNLKDQIITLLKAQGVVPKIPVPFIWGPPGGGKTDLGEAIATELGYQYIDVRLTHYDESVVAGFPYLTPVTAKGFDAEAQMMKSGYPWWVVKAHNQPTIIVFDELNRANQKVRDPMLQVLCERRLGEYSFPDHVKMVACGNLGEEDGTEVDSLDNAHLNRFAHFDWKPTTKQWVNWGEANDLNPCIMAFYKIRETTLYTKPNDEKAHAFSTPRSVTALARLADFTLGAEDRTSYKKVAKFVDEFGLSIIGEAYHPLLKFLREQSTFAAKDILNRYSEVRDQAMALESSRHAEFLQEIKVYKFFDLKAEQVENLAKFLNDIRPDTSMGYAAHLVKELRKYPGDFNQNESVKIMKTHCLRFFQSLDIAEKKTAR